MLAAALIDLDGLLVNTEELYFEATRTFLAGLGHDYTAAMHREGMGKKFGAWIETVLGPSVSGTEIARGRNALFLASIPGRVRLMPGAEVLLERIRPRLKTALVTSASRACVEAVDRATGVGRWFDQVVTGDMVARGKPDPACYLIAARALGVAPAACVVLEDAPNGVRAGKAANMAVIAVPSAFAAGDEAFALADAVTDSLADISFERLAALIP